MKQSLPVTIGVVFAALLALGGLAVSAILLQHHIAVEVGGDPILGGLCKDAGGQSSCDAALASRVGQDRRRQGRRTTTIPTAMLGFVFFACMSSWYIVVGRASGSRRGLHLLPVIGTSIGALICVGLDVIMWVKLPEPCWLCLATHIITWVLFLLTLILWPRRAAAPVRWLFRPAEAGIETAYTTRAKCLTRRCTWCWRPLLLAVATSAAGWETYRSAGRADSTCKVAGVRQGLRGRLSADSCRSRRSRSRSCPRTRFAARPTPRTR